MVTGPGTGETAAMTGGVGARARGDDVVIRVDGSRPMSAELIAALGAACDSAEDHHSRLIARMSGAPEGSWAGDLTVALVSRWERGLRRLERLPVATIGIASGDCGGPALDALLATDYRIAVPSVRLLVPVGGQATWPGMALYRLAHQAGAAAIRRTALFGFPIEADEALALHLIDEVTDDADSALAAAAELLGAFSGSELAIRRELVLGAATASFEDALGAHLAACDRALRRVAAGAAR
jgi:isomerase DpgB